MLFPSLKSIFVYRLIELSRHVSLIILSNSQSFEILILFFNGDTEIDIGYVETFKRLDMHLERFNARMESVGRPFKR